MNKQSKIYIAGASGMVGSSIVRILKKRGYKKLLIPNSNQLDLIDQSKVDKWFKNNRPEYVFLCAGKVGGMFSNMKYPADYSVKNTLIIANVINMSFKYDIKKLLFMGSSCLYPIQNGNKKIKPEMLLSRPMENSNIHYSISKINGYFMCLGYNKQYGTNYITPMPCNIYGPGDNFSENHSHVIPALIRKFHFAKLNKTKNLIIAGSGNVKREFLYVDDLAEASIFLMHRYNNSKLINVGSGKDISIKNLSYLIKKIIGYEGNIIFDRKKPEGVKKKLLDVSVINKMGWRQKTDIISGLTKAYKYYKKVSNIN